jgi:uncharacterized tellurite resistance protein B-like protein
MTNFTISERFAIINILSKIMEADHIIHPNEVAFMDKTLAEFEISESDIATINLYEFEQCRSIIQSLDADKKETAINLFVEMANCDGYADPRELEIIKSLGSL